MTGKDGKPFDPQRWVEWAATGPPSKLHVTVTQQDAVRAHCRRNRKGQNRKECPTCHERIGKSLRVCACGYRFT